MIASPRVLTSTVEQSSSKAASCFCTVASSWKEGGGVNQGGPPGRGCGTHLPLTLPGPVEEVQQHGRVVYLLLLWHTVEAYAFGGLLQRVPSEGENGTETHTRASMVFCLAMRCTWHGSDPAAGKTRDAQIFIAKCYIHSTQALIWANYTANRAHLHPERHSPFPGRQA